ncbi:MAG: lytic transglycosylase domain-containing protein [Candidatus Kapabacteria bacterium]|nr:lytic transglycosylase domain-containing protein [Candidatus Kapabacteria bacterium]MDW7996343.1 lytic transglycosylase domain-containing protein [Bacteroidota bacterium]
MTETLQPTASPAASPGSHTVNSSVERERLSFVARGFESLVLFQLLRSLQQPLFADEDGEEEPLPGFGAGPLDEFVLLPFAEALAQSGRGVGLAEWLYRHWTGEELPLRSGAVGAAVSTVQSPRIENTEEPTVGPPTQRVLATLRPYWGWIEQASARTGLPPALIAAVVWAESAGNPRAVSPAGAQGLMQLMPETARELGVSDPFAPQDNLLGGSRYLQQMLHRFGELPLALAAYNAGPARVLRYGGIPPFAETQTYVRRVLALYRQIEAAATTEAPASP